MVRNGVVRSLLAMTLLAGSTFASGPTIANASGTPATTNNDDTCDIVVAPAATLLLPYFEVDFVSTQATARQTVVTVANVSAYPQIAHVTLWTDWAYPILDFNVYLTGYDVQSFNLYDVIARGLIQPTTRNNPPGGPSPPGSRSLSDAANLNLASIGCNDLMANIDASLRADIQTALTIGSYPSGCGNRRIGGTHAHAIGYATIDVTSVCSFTLPTSSDYYASEILFDNVLIGDYEQIDPGIATGNYAGGDPMVHIRAVPEGGLSGAEAVATTLSYTFYDLYTPEAAPAFDRRQPLPSQFAARYVQGGPTNFNTNYKVWRESVNAVTSCDLAFSNSAMPIVDIIRFDEHENPTREDQRVPIITGSPAPPPTAPATSARSTTNSVFPFVSTAAGDVSGWMYLNLNNGGSAAYHAHRGFTGSPAAQGPNSNVSTAASGNPGRGVGATVAVRPSQNWVTVSMFAEGRYSVDFDAASLGNGCSLSPATNDLIGPNGGVIGPTNPIGNTTP